MKFPKIAALALASAFLMPAAPKASPGPEGVAGYPLTKINPTGFSVHQGIVDWVPISATQAVAFARNYQRSSDTHSLKSYVLTKNGAASGSRLFASGLGSPRAAAGFWIEAVVPYGLLFVLFEKYDSATRTETGKVAVARFDRSGKLAGGWKTLLDIDPGPQAYFGDEALYAVRESGSIVVVVSGQFSYYAKPNTDSSVYFLETDLAGGLVGTAVALSLPGAGKDIYALGSGPDWNGSVWLVPVSATLYKAGGDWDEIIGNRVLIYSVSAAHAAVGNEIARDAVLSPMTYDGLVLAADPVSATGRLLFVRHRTLLPKSKQKQDMFKYDYSLKSLDAEGKPLGSRTLAIPKTAHATAYNPAYKIDWEYDHWSKGVVRGEKLYLSNGRTVFFRNDKARDYPEEQQVNFYEINLRTAAVEHRARTISVWPDVEWLVPILHAFPGGPLAVVNNAYHMPPPYPRDNYITLFGD